MPDPAAGTVFPPGTPAEAQPPAEPIKLGSALPGKIDWKRGARASVLAGVMLALAMFFIPVMVAGIGLSLHLGQGGIGLLVVLSSWCCMAFGGALAVRFYRRQHQEFAMSAGMGARLGALTGLFGFFFYAVPQALRLAFLHLASSVREAMQKAIEQSAAQNPDPRAQEMMRNLLSPGAIAAFITVLVVLFFVFFIALASLGGAITASKRQAGKSA